jgi:hypothetical protein
MGIAPIESVTNLACCTALSQRAAQWWGTLDAAANTQKEKTSINPPGGYINRYLMLDCHGVCIWIHTDEATKGDDG